MDLIKSTFEQFNFNVLCNCLEKVINEDPEHLLPFSLMAEKLLDKILHGKLNEDEGLEMIDVELTGEEMSCLVECILRSLTNIYLKKLTDDEKITDYFGKCLTEKHFFERLEIIG